MSPRETPAHSIQTNPDFLLHWLEIPVEGRSGSGKETALDLIQYIDLLDPNTLEPIVVKLKDRETGTPPLGSHALAVEEYNSAVRNGNIGGARAAAEKVIAARPINHPEFIPFSDLHILSQGEDRRSRNFRFFESLRHHSPKFLTSESIAAIEDYEKGLKDPPPNLVPPKTPAMSFTLPPKI